MAPNKNPARAKIRVRDPDEFERWRGLIEKARQRREKGVTPKEKPEIELALS